MYLGRIVETGTREEVYDRCWKAQDECARVDPKLVVRPGSHHLTACLFAEEATVPVVSQPR